MAEIDIIADDSGYFTGYLAAPPNDFGPGLIVIQEIFGVNHIMRDLCDGFAAQGYFALCPDLFWRQQPGIQLTDKTDAEWSRAFALMQGFDVDKGVSDLRSALASLRSIDGCSGKAGSVGYCLGGKLAFLMATRSSSDCNVSYYGVGLDELLGETVHIQNPLLMHVAEQDRFVPADAQETIVSALSGHAKVSLYRYPNVNHAFAREGGEHYDPGAAQLANERTKGFLSAHLT